MLVAFAQTFIFIQSKLFHYNSRSSKAPLLSYSFSASVIFIFLSFISSPSSFSFYVLSFLVMFHFQIMTLFPSPIAPSLRLCPSMFTSYSLRGKRGFRLSKEISNFQIVHIFYVYFHFLLLTRPFC